MNVLLSWSGGKDSALALYELRRSDPSVTVAYLHTTADRALGRINSHGVRRELIALQAGHLGLPLVTSWVEPGPPAEGEADRPMLAPDAHYERSLDAFYETARAWGVEAVVFGDIFLEDLRAYRETILARHGLAGIYPLWGRDTGDLYRAFCDLGFRALTVATDPERLGPEFLGRPLDRDFLRDLPAGADPCGENGEYHTFVHDGPLFRSPVPWVAGEQFYQYPYRFQDLAPPELAYAF